VLVQFLGAVTALVLDVISYLVSAVLLLGLPRPAQARPAPGPTVRAQIAEGWRFVVRHPVMRPCLLDATALNFVCGAQLALIPLFLVRTLGASPAMVGLMLATEGIGSLIGASLTPRLVARFGSGRMTLWGGVAAAVFGLLLPLATSGWGLVVFGLGFAGFAGGVVITSITTRTYRQTASPPELLARVMATVRFVSWGATPVGALVAGVLATRFGVREALFMIELLAFVSPAVIAASPIRRMRDLEPEVELAA
jgi:predicted MFS family arabinose efflux permease